MSKFAIAVFVQSGIPAPETEFAFHPTRRWKFDYAWSSFRIALEVEGGIWTGGRHNRAAGFLADIEKYNAAAIIGWRVLRTTPDNLLKASTLEMIREAIAFQSI